jgi:hypothetical protein
MVIIVVLAVLAAMRIEKEKTHAINIVVQIQNRPADPGRVDVRAEALEGPTGNFDSGGNVIDLTDRD